MLQLLEVPQRFIATGKSQVGVYQARRALVTLIAQAAGIQQLDLPLSHPPDLLNGAEAGAVQAEVDIAPACRAAFSFLLRSWTAALRKKKGPFTPHHTNIKLWPFSWPNPMTHSTG